MKRELLILILAFNPVLKGKCQTIHYPSLIDQIQTVADLDSFIKNEAHLKYPFLIKKPDYMYLPKLSNIYDYFFDSLTIAPFSKYDFDKDGHTDLLINGSLHSKSAAIVIISKENGKLETHLFFIGSNRSLNIQFVKLDTSAHIGKLDYYLINVDSLINKISYKKIKEEYKRGYLRQVRCVYKYGGFIEENPNPVAIRLDSIEFERSGIFSDYYNHYRLCLSKNRKAILEVGSGNKNLSGPQQYGTYEGHLNKEQFDQLQNIAGYINLILLKSKYDNGATDPAWCDLKVIYNKKDTIRILDRNNQGTFGLMVLYDFFDKLYNELKWKKVNK